MTYWAGTDEAWLTYVADPLGYLGAKILPGDRYAALAPMLFTTAIIVGQVGDTDAYDDRWCYEEPVPALLALQAWDGEGEPVGWHRHPRSGRRVARTGNEVDENGRMVPAGQVYVCR